MAHEIEAKLKVDSLKAVEKRLKDIGAEFTEKLSQTDTYFDDSTSSMLHSDQALRIRKQKQGDIRKYFLTYKGPKLKEKFKQRKELELKIQEPEKLKQILQALGYEQKLKVQKKRNIWKFRDMLIMLDSLPALGNFVEIEGPDSRSIEQLQEKLGLAEIEHIPDGYASLMEKKTKIR